MARVLDVKEFGVFGFGIAVLGFLGNFIIFGFDRISLRDLAIKKKSVNQYSNNILAVRLIISIVLFCFLLTAIILLNNKNSSILIVLLLGLIFQAVSLSFIFRAVEQFKIISKTQIVTSILTVVLYIIFVRQQEDTIYAACIYSANTLISVIILFSIYVKQFGKIKLSIEKIFTKYLIRESYPLFVSSIMVAIYYSSDIIMLGFIKNDWDVGIYTAANKIFILGTIPFQLIASVFLPKIAAKKDFVNYRNYFHLMGLCGAIIGITTYFLSYYIILIVFGSIYLPAVFPLKILALNILVVSVNMGLGEPITVLGKQKQYLIAVTFGAVINIILNFVLIPNYSYMGASIATLFSESVVFVGLLIVYRLKNYEK